MMYSEEFKLAQREIWFLSSSPRRKSLHTMSLFRTTATRQSNNGIYDVGFEPCGTNSSPERQKSRGMSSTS